MAHAAERAGEIKQDLILGARASLKPVLVNLQENAVNSSYPPAETDTDGKVTKAAYWTHADTDISKESTEVQSIANAVWTDAIKKAYKAHMESTLS